MEIKSAKQRVLNLLKTDAATRDSDFLLLSRMWKEELGNTTFMTGSAVLAKIAEGKLTNPESIRRNRQKLQQEHPELRGRSYTHRHNEQEPVKQELREYNDDGTVKDQLTIFHV